MDEKINKYMVEKINKYGDGMAVIACNSCNKIMGVLEDGETKEYVTEDTYCIDCVQRQASGAKVEQ